MTGRPFDEAAAATAGRERPGSARRTATLFERVGKQRRSVEVADRHERLDQIREEVEDEERLDDIGLDHRDRELTSTSNRRLAASERNLEEGDQPNRTL